MSIFREKLQCPLQDPWRQSKSNQKDYGVKSDTVAVLAVLPRYPRYYRWNGCNFYGITAVLGPKYAGFPWRWGQSCGTTAAMGLIFSHVHEN